jgi:tetratricopeptide (TPR) repeat protein
MKFLIIISLLLQLVTNLSADLAFEEYMHQKEVAYSLYDSGDKDGALASVENFIRKNPTDLRAQNLLAVLYFWSGDIQKAKSISLNILQKENFKPSRTLLKSIAQREGVSFSRLPNVKKEKKVQTPNLLGLIQNVKKDPQDIMSRKILALHYEKIGNSKQASYFANEVLKLNPDDRDMIVLIKDDNVYASKDKVAKTLEKLNYFYRVGNYASFMNLYQSLEHNNVVLPTQVHISALDVAIELKEYQKAKSIIHIYRMPKS